MTIILQLYIVVCTMIPAHLYFISSYKDKPRQIELNSISLCDFILVTLFLIIMLKVHRINRADSNLKILLVFEIRFC